MNKKLLHLIIFCLLSTLFRGLFAQDELPYTYMGDRKFTQAKHLFGYTFVPDLKEIPGKDQYSLKAGEVQIGVSRDNLFVKGKDIGGVYNVNTILTTEYGYQLKLINARDPGQLGHLKIILLNGKFADALVFKKDNHASEIIFFLPQLDEEIRIEEKEYYTDRSEIILDDPDGLWGLELSPFHRIVSPKGVCQRIYVQDSVRLNFIETETVIEKTKKVKTKNLEESEEEDIQEPIEELVEEPKEEIPEEEMTEEEKQNALFDSFFGDEAEEELEEDVEDLPTTTEDLEITEFFGEESSSNEPKVEEVVKKVKYKYDYSLDVTELGYAEDGSVEMFTQTFEITNMKFFEDPGASDPYYSFRLELETNRGPVFMYLDHKQRISSVDFGDVEYLMRGH